MSRSSYETILSAIARLDADAEAVQRLVQEARSELLRLSRQPKRTRKQTQSAISLTKQIEALPLRLVAGRKKSLGELLRDIKAATSADLLDELKPENFYQSGPFMRLGNLPVSRSAEVPAVTHLRDLFPVFGEESRKKIPINGPSLASHTYWMHYSKSWWSTLLYTRYSASTNTTATGWEACDVLGGQYASAKEACQTLVVPPPGDPNHFIIAFLKAAACNYATSAPETPFPSLNIKTVVCSCFVKAGDGSCNPYKRNLSGEFELDDMCREKIRTDTAGPVELSYSHWVIDGPTCLGVTSRHDVDFVQGVSIIEDFC
jgi:hypothetical protein